MPHKGYKATEEHKRKNRDTHLGKKLPPGVHGYWKGKTFSEEHKLRMGKSNLKEKNWSWKGVKASYVTKHVWLHINYGSASKCENPNCDGPFKKDGTKKTRFHWANISDKYLRDVTDYIQLCVPCHSAWDRGKISIIGIIKKPISLISKQ
jgi:hypothetical protein